MSRIRKHVTIQLEQEYPEPSKEDNEFIVRVVEVRGTNQVQVEYPNGEQILVMLPTKFRKLVWVKKGMYLIISTNVDSNKSSIKIKGIVKHVLQNHHISHLKKENLWPDEFNEDKKEEMDDEEEDDRYKLPEENPNRIQFSDTETDTDSEDEEE